MNGFEAQLHDPECPGGTARGRVDIDAGSLLFVAYEGDQVKEIPLSTDVEMRLGGARDHLVFFSHPAMPGVTIHTENQTILDHPVWRNHQLSEQARRLRRKRSWLSVSLWVGAGVGLAAVLLFALSVFGLVIWAMF